VTVPFQRSVLVNNVVCPKRTSHCLFRTKQGPISLRCAVKGSYPAGLDCNARHALPDFLAPANGPSHAFVHSNDDKRSSTPFASRIDGCRIRTVTITTGQTLKSSCPAAFGKPGRDAQAAFARALSAESCNARFHSTCDGPLRIVEFSC
jgi:hypothetical protein